MASKVWGPTPAANTFAHMQGAAQPRSARPRTPEDRNSSRGLECNLAIKVEDEVKHEHVHVHKASERIVEASVVIENIESEKIVMAVNVHEEIVNEEKVDVQQGASCLCREARADVLQVASCQCREVLSGHWCLSPSRHEG